MSTSSLYWHVYKYAHTHTKMHIHILKTTFGVVVYAHYLSTQEVEAGRSEIQVYFGYIASSRIAWNAWDHILKRDIMGEREEGEKEERERQREREKLGIGARFKYQHLGGKGSL